MVNVSHHIDATHLVQSVCVSVVIHNNNNNKFIFI